MEGRRVGRYTFQLGPAETGGMEAGEVVRVKVKVMDGTTTVETFNIDLSADIELNVEPDVRQIPRGDNALLLGYPSVVRVRLYPIENQIADKLSAIYSTFGSGGSTRYRDLYDLAMIVDQLPFKEEILAAALRAQQQLRRISIPVELGEPAKGWSDAYERQLARTPSAKPPFTNYGAAMKAVREALVPILRNGGTQSAAEASGRPIGRVGEREPTE